MTRREPACSPALGQEMPLPGGIKRRHPRQAVSPQNEELQWCFLIDTSATFSILPSKGPAARNLGSLPSLKSAGSQAIACFGEQALLLVFGGQRFEWNFLLADMGNPLIGAKFLRHHHLVVDLHAGHLIQGESFQRLGCGGSAHPSGLGGGLAAVVESTPLCLRRLISEFQDVANPLGSLPPVRHQVEHLIKTTGRAVTARFQWLDAAKLRDAKAEFLQMERDSIIRPSSSPWSSPLYIGKKDGMWQPCRDYCRLNAATIPDKYPVPSILDMSVGLAGWAVFTKLDLKKGYWQIPVAAADIPKTAVITLFGLWEFLWMPFGLRNIGQSATAAHRRPIIHVGLHKSSS